MRKSPIYISPRTFRSYEMYKEECARTKGWNDAMDTIFGKRKKKSNIREVLRKEGDIK